VAGVGVAGDAAQNNINFGLNWRATSTNIVNPFPSLAGGTGTQGLNAQRWLDLRQKIAMTNIFRVNYNHNHVATTNLYSNVTDVAGPGAAGISGISERSV